MTHIYLIGHKSIDQLFGIENAPYLAQHPRDRSIQEKKIQEIIDDYLREHVVPKDVFVIQHKIYYGTVDLTEELVWDMAAINPFRNPEMRSSESFADALRIYAAKEGDRIVVCNNSIVDVIREDIKEIMQPTLKIIK